MPYALLFKIKVQVNVCTLLYTCMYTCAIPFKRGRKYGLQRCQNAPSLGLSLAHYVCNSLPLKSMYYPYFLQIWHN